MVIREYPPFTQRFIGDTEGNEFLIALNGTSAPALGGQDPEEKVATSIATFFLWAAKEREAQPIPVPAVTVPNPPNLPFSLDIDVTKEGGRGWEITFHTTTRYLEQEFENRYRDRRFVQYQLSRSTFFPRFTLLFQATQGEAVGTIVDQLLGWVDAALPSIRQLFVSLFATLGEGEPEEIIAARVFRRWSDPRCYPKIAFDPTTFRFHLRDWQLCPTCEWAIYNRLSTKTYIEHVTSYQHMAAELGIPESRIRRITRGLKAFYRMNEE